MKGTITIVGVLVMSMALSTNAFAHGKGGAKGMGMMHMSPDDMSDEMLDRMADQMQSMYKILKQLEATSDPAQRRELVKAHMKQRQAMMQEGMKMMGRKDGKMGQGMKVKGMKAHGMGMQGQGMGDWQKKMEARMKMMEQMLQKNQ